MSDPLHVPTFERADAPAPRRTIVVGDLHGCRAEAEELLETLAVTSSDRVIFAGDLVDRGPDPRGCVELAMRHEAVLGNHEEKHLRIRGRPDEALSPDHLRTRQALDDEHYAYLHGLPLFLRIPEANAAVVHAGVLWDRPLERQSDHVLLHGQHLCPPRKESKWPSKAPPDWRFWTHFWKGPERVIFGHTVLDRPLVSEHAVGIDTGCVHGYALTAVVLPEWRLVQVPARKAWWGPKGDGVTLYDVMDGVKCWS